jgi:hypothetical protein
MADESQIGETVARRNQRTGLGCVSVLS